MREILSVKDARIVIASGRSIIYILCINDWGREKSETRVSTSCMVGAGIYIYASCKPVTLVARMHGNACVANYMKVVRPAVHTVSSICFSITGRSNLLTLKAVHSC